MTQSMTDSKFLQVLLTKIHYKTIIWSKKSYRLHVAELTHS